MPPTRLNGPTPLFGRLESSIQVGLRKTLYLPIPINDAKAKYVAGR